MISDMWMLQSTRMLQTHYDDVSKSKRRDDVGMLACTLNLHVCGGEKNRASTNVMEKQKQIFVADV